MPKFIRFPPRVNEIIVLSCLSRSRKDSQSQRKAELESAPYEKPEKQSPGQIVPVTQCCTHGFLHAVGILGPN